MGKIKRYTSEDGGYHGELGFMCPGCGHRHFIYDNETTGHDLCWTFNKDFEKPTVSPSVLVWNNKFNPETGKYDIEINRCHSFIRDGKIQFLDDCMHSLKGQTVELPEIN